MNAIRSHQHQQPRRSGAAVFSLRVGATDCSVRGFPMAMIHDLLGFEDEIEAVGDRDADPSLVADVIESRMIAPPRPRRRRERPVSSRALFYAADAAK
jgi:hypothetical protein